MLAFVEGKHWLVLNIKMGNGCIGDNREDYFGNSKNYENAKCEIQKFRMCAPDYHWLLNGMGCMLCLQEACLQALEPHSPQALLGVILKH